MAASSQITEIDAETIRSGNRAAQSITAGFAADIPALDYFWRVITTALADVPALLARLAQARVRWANLAAAARAAIRSDREGEQDRLSYLRDELAAQGQHIPGGNGETR